MRTYKPRKPKARRGRMLRAVQLRAEGKSLREVARVLEVTHPTVIADLRRWDEEAAKVTSLVSRGGKNSPPGGENLPPELTGADNVIPLRMHA